MISIVIPTLQKSISTLELLLKTLNADDAVGEIIVIDNSLKGLDIKLPKLRVITPLENLYVNPSWNLGVSEAKFEKIGLLNDDIAIPYDFCKQVEPYLSSQIGIVGMKDSAVIPVKEIIIPEPSKIKVEPVNYRDTWFGVAMFFHKDSYDFIPETMKIHAGDDWIVYQCKRKHKQNYFIGNAIVHHLGSLSSSAKNFNPILKSDAKIYRKLTLPWYKIIWSYDEFKNHYKLRFLGITINIRKNFQIIKTNKSIN